MTVLVPMQVMIRLRPLNSRENSVSGKDCSLQQLGSSSLYLKVEGRDYNFRFDDVMGEDGSQEELFKRALLPVDVAVLIMLACSSMLISILACIV
jgi:hypothetical protein